MAQVRFPDHATLTLDTALDIVRTEEVTSIQVKGISRDVSSRVDVLKHGRASSKAGNFPSKHRGPIIRVDIVTRSTIYLNDLYAHCLCHQGHWCIASLPGS